MAAFVALLRLLRRDRLSFGLPVAYLYLLLLIHVPGAFAHIVGRDFLLNSDLVEIGMGFTALGSVCFAAGVWWTRSSPLSVPIRLDVDRPRFWLFCLIGGWTCIYGLTPLYQIPSVSAAIDKAGGIWMLGVMLGLRAALQRDDRKWTVLWLGRAHGIPRSHALARRLSELWFGRNHSRLFGTHDFDTKLWASRGRYCRLCIPELEHLCKLLSTPGRHP